MMVHGNHFLGGIIGTLMGNPVVKERGIALSIQCATKITVH